LKFLSGLQTGADLGGLKAAKELGFETGGTMPKGFLNETGNHPEYALLYGAVEHKSSHYNLRTYANVHDSDGTIRFASNFHSPGERCTFKAIEKIGKPHIDIDVNKPIDHNVVRKWLAHHNIKVLNVAGNRESTCPGIEKFVIEYLKTVFNDEGKTS